MQLILFALNAYTWIILIRALLSWVSPDPNNPLVQILHKLTEPVLKPLRQLVPPQKLGGIDISPLLAIVLLQFARRLVFAAYWGI